MKVIYEVPLNFKNSLSLQRTYVEKVYRKDKSLSIRLFIMTAAININTGNIQNTVGKKSAKIEMSMNIFVDEVE